MVYLSGAGLPRLSWKGHYTDVVVVVVVVVVVYSIHCTSTKGADSTSSTVGGPIPYTYGYARM